MPWLLQAVRTFDNFTPDNDPYGEHDLGSVDWHNEKTYWKIDYYDQASFQEKRNALDVLGVRVVVQEPVETYSIPSDVDNISSGQEWFSAKEAARLLGVNAKTIHFYQKNGTITNYKYEPFLLVHRDELLKLQKKGFLQRNTEEIVRARAEISYSPRFNVRGNNLTSVPVSLHTRKYINASACCTPCTLYSFSVRKLNR